MAHRRWRIWAAAMVALLGIVVVGCSQPEPTPTPAPFPTALPSPTPPIHQVIDGLRYVISIDGVALAGEEIHASRSEDELIVSSELRYLTEPHTIERRTLVLNAAMSPMRYELERVTLGVRSLWVSERTTRGTAMLNNHQALPGPIAWDGVSPAADIMIETAPSAIPYVLLALRSLSLSDAQPSIEIQTVNIVADLPTSWPLTLKSAPARTGAVIGTAAIEAEIPGGPNPSLALWVRPESGELYGAEVPDFAADPWLGQVQPEMATSARLEIKRVQALPQAPESEIQPSAQALSIETLDGKSLSAALSLPSGAGPHPCLISLGAGSITTRLSLGEAWLDQGWAVCELDPRGTGDSEGDYQRGDLVARAEDAVAVASAVAQRDDIDADRLVLIGMGDAGLAVALALGLDDMLAGAVMGATALHAPLVPELFSEWIAGPLAVSRGWTPDDAEAYRLASVDQWQRWLFDGEDEVSLVRRRVSLDELQAYAETDIQATLAASEQPILLLVGETAQWPSPQMQLALAEGAAEAGREAITVGDVPTVGDILWAQPGRTLSPAAQEVIAKWLSSQGL